MNTWWTKNVFLSCLTIFFCLAITFRIKESSTYWSIDMSRELCWMNTRKITFIDYIGNDKYQWKFDLTDWKLFSRLIVSFKTRKINETKSLRYTHVYIRCKKFVLIRSLSVWSCWQRIVAYFFFSFQDVKTDQSGWSNTTSFSCFVVIIICLQLTSLAQLFKRWIE